MLIYWLLLLLPAGVALTQPPGPELTSRRLSYGWLYAWLGLALLVGLRHFVGGDWTVYERHYRQSVGVPLGELLSKGDPGYYLFVWMALQLDAGIYAVNLACAMLFSTGLVVFCRHQPRPWLALCVAVPYMVIVLGMGYTRQGVALGVAMLGLVALERGRNFAFVLSVALAATFHKSAVLLVPLAVLSTQRGKVWTAAWVGVAGVALYWSVLADSVDSMVANYVEAGYQSEGAAVRVAMCALPALLLLGLRRRFRWHSLAERNLWSMMAWLALAALVWLVLSPSSTAVDRVALYLIPLQLYVLSRLPDIFGDRAGRQGWVNVVVSYSVLVQFVWMFFAVHASFWIPYRFYPWEVFWR